MYLNGIKLDQLYKPMRVYTHTHTHVMVWDVSLNVIGCFIWLFIRNHQNE